LRFDLPDRGGFAEAGDVGEVRLVAENLFDLCAGFFAAQGEVETFAAPEADEVGDEADLRGRPFAVRSVDLPVDVAGIDLPLSRNQSVQGSVTV